MNGQWDSGTAKTSPGRGGNFKPLIDRRDRMGGGLQLGGPGRDDFWQVVGSAIDGGLGVLLARTSDGGAISITVYDGDDRHRTYCGNEEELVEAQAAIRDVWEAQQLRTPVKRGKR